MNYRHSYHAGCFSDVFKHTLVIALILALQRKDTPFFYYDTHAAAGYYDLLAETTQKSKEYQLGISKILQQENPPALIKKYSDIVWYINAYLSKSKQPALRYYPGSPGIVRQLLRPKDHMALSELQPQEYQILKSFFARDPQVSVHNIDGYLGVKALLPPKERRGLILIDPPFEKSDDFNQAVTALGAGLKRFEQGIFAFWYPIKDPHPIARLHREVKAHIIQPMLLTELCIFPEDTAILNGCGMIIVNPPWQFKEDFEVVLAWLWKALSIQGQGRYTCNLLK